MYFTSDLVNSGPLGSGYAGILYDNSSSTKQMTYLFPDPREINGSYTFTYHLLDTAALYFPNGFVNGSGIGETAGAPPGRVLFMLEFIGYV